MKVMLRKTLILVGLCLLIVLSFSRVSLALTIESIKDGKVLISLDGSSAKVGDTFLALDHDGKRRAFIKVQQVRGPKALGSILKGQLTQAPQTYMLQSHVLGSQSTRASGFGNAPPSAWGILGGFAQNQMSVKLATANVDMKGSGMSVEGFYERQIDGAFQMLARFGYQTLKTSGTTTGGACQGTNDCTVDLSYLGLDGLVKYSFFRSRITYWLAGGLGFAYPIGKSSNVLDVSKISVNQKILVDSGLNWYLNRKSYMPVQLEYAMFPNNSVVTSSQIFVRLGYGRTF